MKVTILVSGHYSSFPYKGKFINHQGPRQWLDAGTETEFPLWYGAGLVESELAEEVPFLEAEKTPPQASQAAEKLAADYRIDLEQVEGSGKDGQITVNDVRAHIPENAG